MCVLLVLLIEQPCYTDAKAKSTTGPAFSHRGRRKVMQTLDHQFTSLPRINGQRLWRSLMDLARIGATAKGGVCRLALTDLDRQARDLVVGWLREASATVEIDGAGNIFAVRKGRSANPAVVLTGSHIDTQP